MWEASIWKHSLIYFPSQILSSFSDRKAYHNIYDQKWCSCVRDRVKNSRIWCNSSWNSKNFYFYFYVRCVLYLVKKPNADNEIKRYKPKIFHIFENSNDNVPAYECECSNQYHFFVPKHCVHVTTIKKDKLNYMFHLIIKPNEKVE